MFDKVLHRVKSRAPPELVQRTVVILERLGDGNVTEKQLDDIAKNLAFMKSTMFSAGDTDQSRDAATILAYEACKVGLPLAVARALLLLEFEARKDAAQVVGAVVRLDSSGDSPGALYIQQNPELLDLLFDGYDVPEIALNCGSMLRDCIRNEQVAEIALRSDLLFRFFPKMEVQNFEVASDAFQSFKDLLTRHTAAVSRFLSANYDEFFAGYTGLLQSENYVTRRQSLKLLGEILLHRSNVKAMMRYVSEVNNLKLMMVLLKDSSRSIQFEAFHVFKVFVANPNKTQPIVDILAGNKEKLLKYLTDFHTDKSDEQFKEEKAVIIKEISNLTASNSNPGSSSGQSASSQ